MLNICLVVSVPMIVNKFLCVHINALADHYKVTVLYFSLFLLQFFYGLFGVFLKQTVKPKAGARRLPIPNDGLYEI